MRIVLTADPELPVPPRLYGGIERIVDLLARGLRAHDHEVTVLAHPDSATAGRLVAWPGRDSRSSADLARNAATLARVVMGDRYDLVHSFSRIAYLAPILALPIPKLMTYQRRISPRAVRLGHALSRGTLEFSAISRWMTRDVEHIGRWSLAPNGVSLDTYQFQPTVSADAPLVFLGRVEEIKGPHLAIEIARLAGRRLVIAGNIPHGHQAWFDAHVATHIDNDQIRYIGPVDDGAKNRLLGSALALLMPILWDEPFGIVMAEAMACGAPVLGLERGAVAEIVEDGVTGYVRRTAEGLAEASCRIGRIDRAACRARVETFYSGRAVTDSYLQIYDRMLAGRRAAA